MYLVTKKISLQNSQLPGFSWSIMILPKSIVFPLIFISGHEPVFNYICNCL